MKKIRSYAKNGFIPKDGKRNCLYPIFSRRMGNQDINKWLKYRNAIVMLTKVLES